MFETLPTRASAVDTCAEALRSAILEGRVSAGARLPTERELAERFGVNRVTVRSALGRLTAAGLVAVRQGSGYLVRDYRRTGGPDLVGALCDLARRSGDITSIARDLLLVRRSLAEAVLTRFVEAPPSVRARRAVAESVRALEALASRGALPAEIADADIEVLGAVLDATGSPVLRLFLNPVTSLLKDIPELTPALYAEPLENVAAFRVLLAWLERPEAKSVAMIVGVMRARDEATVARLAASHERSRGRRTKKPARNRRSARPS